jgi:hypothetical protein
VPTYLELRAEPVWGAQYVPGNLDAVLIQPLRTFFNLGPAWIGAPGDNNHLYGRHRSANWDRLSMYCTDRSYGTTDARDHRGDQDWYRAVDVGITGQTLYDACRRVDTLVRAGQLPGLAEWFGTLDGRTVVGWFEGHASSSDDSHLRHLHLGPWNEFADDEATMRLLYDAITGVGDDMTPDQANKFEAMVWRVDAIYANRPATVGGPYKGEPNRLYEKLAEIAAQADMSDAQYAQLLADVTAAAEAGAEAGAPSAEDLEQAAFEGAQRAEDH